MNKLFMLNASLSAEDPWPPPGISTHCARITRAGLRGIGGGSARAVQSCTPGRSIIITTVSLTLASEVIEALFPPGPGVR